MRVAVSYRRTDQSETLDLLMHSLIERFGADNVYKDLTSNRVGEPWILRSGDAYMLADAILVIIGPNWSPERLKDKSDAVRLELWAAVAQAVPLVPVLIDGAVMPNPRHLPRFMRSLIMRHGTVIHQQQRQEEITAFVDQLEHNTLPPHGWRERLISARRRDAAMKSFDLSGQWEWRSTPTLLYDIVIQQDRRILRLHALGAYDDEIVGEGFLGIGDDNVSFMLRSMKYGTAGALILKYRSENRGTHWTVDAAHAVLESRIPEETCHTAEEVRYLMPSREATAFGDGFPAWS